LLNKTFIYRFAMPVSSLMGLIIRCIRALLGHKRSKTTEVYTHVTTKSIQKIKLPFDDLEI